MNYYDSALLGPPPPPQHINSLAYIPSIPKSVANSGKFTNVFGFDDISYQHIVNKLNGVNYGIPSQLVPPPFETPSLFTNGYGYINYGAVNNFDTAYISHDGRILKQYSVHERIHNDLPNPSDDYQPKPTVFTQTQPSFLPPNYVPNNINFAQPRNINVGDSNTIPTFLNKNHGPVAFGSGGLGVVRSVNGEVFLGSGSLGYTTHKDHYDNVMAIHSRRQKQHPRGPTSFGHHF